MLLFGAGRMAHVTAKHLLACDAGPVSVYSRTYARAQALAETLSGSAVELSGLMDTMRNCDVIVGCASAPHHLVGPRELGEAMTAREGRPLVVVDLGMPRNVDPAAAALPGLHLFNLDDLEQIVAQHRGAREAEVARVEAIVAEEVEAFSGAEAEREAAALIAGLREKAERLRQECLQQVGPDGADRDYLTDLLVRKLLHQPLVALRSAGAERREIGRRGGEAVRVGRGREGIAHRPVFGGSMAAAVTNRPGDSPRAGVASAGDPPGRPCCNRPDMGACRARRN